MQHITLIPSRIGCPSIPGTMKGIIMSMPGVTETVIHYEERSIDVDFDEGKTSAEAIIKKIGEEMGLAMRPKNGNEEKMTAGETCPM